MGDPLPWLIEPKTGLRIIFFPFSFHLLNYLKTPSFPGIKDGFVNRDTFYIGAEKKARAQPPAQWHEPRCQNGTSSRADP